MVDDCPCWMRHGTVVALIVLVLAGCRDSRRPISADAVRIEVIDEAAFADVLRRHRGKIVLVDFWAMWCPPCRELFPHTVALHERFSTDGLAVISVSVDDPDKEPAVRKFLAEQGAAFENFISRYGSGAKSFEVFGIANGAVPHFQLYDRRGTLRKTFPSGDELTIDLRQLDQAVRELLREGR